MGKQWKQCQTLFWGGSKITADGDCSHETKRCLLLGRKVLTKLDSVLKSKDIILPTKVHLVKAMVFPVAMYGCENWAIKKPEHRRIMLLNCGVGEDSWESIGLQGDPTSPILKEISPGCLLEGLMWSRNFNTLTTWYEDLTHWKRPWCWEGTGGEGDDIGWDSWMASLTQWTWVWVDSGSWWWTGRPGVLRFMGLQRVGHDWRLNWTCM